MQYSQQRRNFLEKFEKHIEVPMFLLVLVMIVTLLLPLVTPLSEETHRTLELIDWIIWGIFFLELTFRTVLAEKKIAYLKKNWIDVLIVVLPVLRIFRVFRLVRVLRVLRFTRVFVFFGKFTKDVKALLFRHHLHYLIIVLCVLIIIGAVLIHSFDRELEQKQTFADAFWLSVVNAFSGGYANTYPLGTEAKIVSILLILLGTVLVSYFTASLASYFTEKEQDIEQERIEKKLDRLLEEIEALKKK